MYNFHYPDLLQHAQTLLTYAVKHSDYCSVIVSQEKPYSQRPPVCDYDDLLEPILPQLVTQLVGIRNWSESGTNDNHTVMNLYRCCKKTRLFLCAHAAECFEYGDFPEDLCFYRGRTVWLSTTTHESYASLYGALPEDLNFLSQANIPYSAGGDLAPYRLPVSAIQGG